MFEEWSEADWHRLADLLGTYGLEAVIALAKHLDTTWKAEHDAIIDEQNAAYESGLGVDTNPKG